MVRCSIRSPLIECTNSRNVNERRRRKCLRKKRIENFSQVVRACSLGTVYKCQDLRNRMEEMSMAIQLQKAQRRAAYLKLGVAGPAGSGKT